MGSWHNGWTGIKIFFENKDLGSCVYSLNNMSLTHGAVNISEDSVRYDVNKLPNTLRVEGNNNSGFLYDINWYDQIFSKELECAKATFNKETVRKLIDYARIIEKA
jgi:hypothetical protein